MKLAALLLSSALFAALAGCSTPPIAATPPGPQPAVASIAPDVACPVVGRTFARGKSSAVFLAKTALAGLSLTVGWTVVFTGQPSTAPPVQFAPRLTRCGPSPGTKPLGSVRDTGGGTTRSSCRNSVCRIEVTYRVIYSAPAKLAGNKPWRYDVIRFYPTKPKLPYGELPGARIEVKKLT
jgi:hypothetical protein